VTDLKDLRETLKQIRHRKPQPKFCPVCRSHRIRAISLIGILPTTYVCDDCGYRGVLTLEIDEDADESDEND
jgi:predicted RNA-binding Zn-ribbon protein involved in translation (DUF1610 family)